MTDPARSGLNHKNIGQPHLSVSLGARSEAIGRAVALLALACLTVFFSFYNLTMYPAPDSMPGYIDDAMHLLAAERIAFNGQYDFGPAVGPTLLLPIAMVMRIFGPSHFPAHVVMAVILLLNVGAFYALVRQLSDWKVSWVATVLYVVSPGTYVVYLGRRVMGEVPAVLFLMAGLLIWFKALVEPQQNRRWIRLALAGILLGLGILTKNQLFLVVPVAFLIWLLDRLYYRQAKNSDPAFLIVPALAIVACWYIIEWFLLPNGQELAARNLFQWADAPTRGIFTFSPRQMSAALYLLTDRNMLYGFALPGVLYAGFRSLQRSKEGLRWAILFAVTAVWLVWFTFFSIGWYRYAFPAITLSTIFVACFFGDLTGGYRLRAREFVAGVRFRNWNPVPVVQAVFIAFLLIATARGAAGRWRDIVDTTSTSHEQMADYIVKHVPGDDVIETFDPEICFLSRHTCSLPSGAMQDAIIRYVWYGGPAPSTFYRPHAPYLLVGYPTAMSGLYDMQAIRRDYELEVSFGVDYPARYDLYRKKTTN